MYQHQIYIGTNVTPAFLFYIKCPEAFVSLERGRVSEGTFQYKHHQWGREGPGQLHCTVGPYIHINFIFLFLHLKDLK